MSAFYEPDGAGAFRATEHARGPWDAHAQHAGPVAALLGRALERCAPRPETRIARIVFEILGPVPLADRLETSARVVRPGRSVELLEAELRGARGPLVRASAWRLRTAPLAGVEPPADPEPPPGPGAAPPWEARLPGIAYEGWHTAVEWRFVRGGFAAPGPATGWMRMRHPLVAGEPISPLARVLCAADAGNGISAELDWNRHLFVNTELTVHLHRLPAGEWVCLQARTLAQPDGIGLAESVLRDERGPIGRAAQALLLAERA